MATLRWPLRLTAAGSLEKDSSYASGVRLTCATQQRSRLLAPDFGVTTRLLEQVSANDEASVTLAEASLVMDLANAVPEVSLEGVSVKRTTRGLAMGVLYTPGNSLDSPRALIVEMLA